MGDPQTTYWSDALPFAKQTAEFVLYFDHWATSSLAREDSGLVGSPVDRIRIVPLDLSSTSVWKIMEYLTYCGLELSLL